MRAEWNEPFTRFGGLYEQAKLAQPKDPNAVTLASVDAEGRPSARVMLMKEFSPRGFVLFTNYDSRKGRELAAQKYAALCFYWPSIDHQVRVEGSAERISSAESDAYFASRPRLSQLGAWASHQSQPFEHRQVFELRLADLTALYEGKPVPRPGHWGGLRIAPRRIEFWSAREGRLHERLLFEQEGDGWETSALFP